MQFSNNTIRYVEAARDAPNIPERNHQTRQAARVNQILRSIAQH